MSHTMYADFSDEAFDAFQNGEAVDKNGFRSTKGYYYPDQPSYRPIDDNNDSDSSVMDNLPDEVKAELLCAIIAAGTALFYEVVLPVGKKFVNEKLYPFACEKFDEIKEKRKNKKELKSKKQSTENVKNNESSVTSEEDNIIDFEDFRIRA